jgi:hypothetical protein
MVPGVRERTFAEAFRDTAPRSFWLEALARRAGDVSLVDWLVGQLNARGHRGAWTTAEVAPDESVSTEELLVALTSPRATADGRIFKLLVRVLQSGNIDLDRLVFLARREGATRVLNWLLGIVPPEERTPSLQAAAQRFALPPRGYRGTDLLYDPSRLLRRKGGTRPWQRKQS